MKHDAILELARQGIELHSPDMPEYKVCFALIEALQPKEAEPTGIEAKVCADITARQMLGINKYGQTVADNPLDLRQWLNHAYEECLDQAVYLRRAMAEMDRAA